MATNNPPVLLTAYPDWATSVGHTFRAPVGANFSDPDGNPLSYSATLENGEPLPAWLTFDPSRTMLNGTPSASDVGIFNITLRATDPSGASATDNITLTVNPVFEGAAQSQVNTTPIVNLNGYSISPKISALPAGGYVAVWTGTESSTTSTDLIDIYVRAFDSNNQPITSEHILSTTTRLHADPQVTTFADGGWLVVWFGLPATGANYTLSAQRFDAAGNQVGPEAAFNVNLNPRQFPAVTTLSSGGYAVTWAESSGGIDPSFAADIYTQLFDSQGSAVSTKLVVNSVRQADQWEPAIAPLKDGGFVIAWQSLGQDGSGFGVYSQKFSANGSRVGSETLVNTTTLNNQDYADVTGLEDGGFVISWSDFSQSPKFQRFDSSGLKIGTEVSPNTTGIGYQGAPH